MKDVLETTREECIEICNSMLRGERSAVETYDQAIDKFKSEPAVMQLSRIRDEHFQSVQDLEKQVLEMGGVPETDSGAWGTFAKAVQGAANLFGEGSAIGSLALGEKKGLEDYRNALESDSLMQPCRELYSVRLAPRIESHLRTLEALEESIG